MAPTAPTAAPAAPAAPVVPDTAPTTAARATATSPALLLRVEGALLLAVAVSAFAWTGVSWWLFAALVLAPDLGLLGYVRGPRWGARTYNLTHTLVGPAALGALGVAADATTVLAVALVWAAHIGLDRAAGFGLKYPTRFQDTHLQRVGPR